MKPAPINPRAPFWRMVDIGGSDACWPWLGPVDTDGYGRCTDAGESRSASRVALVLATGIDPDGLHALHSCDNPPCCNPGHLRWGTHSENMRDKVARGRWRGPGNQSGSANGAAKLSDDQLEEIVRRLKAGLNNKECAEGMPIGHAMVSTIRVGKMWRDQAAALGWVPKPQFKRRNAQPTALLPDKSQ